MMAGMSNTLPDELRALLGELVSDIGERVYLRGEDGPEARHDISVIAAPVYDHHQRQVMVVSCRSATPSPTLRSAIAHRACS